MNDRKRGFRRVDELIEGAGRKAFRAHGFIEASVVTKWRSIVGDLLADHCLPLSMRFPRGQKRGATLSVQAEGAFALQLQHLEPVITERLNVFFGYAAVDKIRIIHAPLPVSNTARMRQKTLHTPTREEENQIMALTRDINDPKLRAAVSNLGRSIASETGKGRNK